MTSLLTSELVGFPSVIAHWCVGQKWTSGTVTGKSLIPFDRRGVSLF